MQTKATSPLMHFPLVDALAPSPMCQPKGTERHKFWSKLRKLCQNPIYLQLPNAMRTYLPNMPSRRLAQCNLQRRFPPPPHKVRKCCTQLLPQIAITPIFTGDCANKSRPTVQIPAIELSQILTIALLQILAQIDSVGAQTASFPLCPY